ncbi:PspC domain-containing protein [Qipengyuania sp.]|uniref:PspC domain-containing protein n=1 Tax=Qipengyuania sp. TaxID=2004515 RepID=UPI0035C8492B
MSNHDIRPVGGIPSRRFRLNKHDGKIMGVAAGIADYAGIDTTTVRIAFVVGALVSFGTAALIYLAIGLIAD